MGIQKLEDKSRSEIEALIDEWIIGKNAYRDRVILKDRLLDGLTYEKIAEKHDMSVRHIKTIVYKSKEKLYKHTSA